MTLLKIKRENESLVLQWDTGKTTSILISMLRDKCPCANCQGETILFKRYEAPKQVPSNTAGRYELQRIDLVGHYAIQPIWKDAHSTGIFSFDYLAEITT